MDIKEKTIEKMKGVFGNDARRIKHALKVLGFSERILEGEQLSGDVREVVLLTAILHDIGIHEAEKKYNSNSGKYQEIEGPPIAKKIMKMLDVRSDIIERVCYIVGGHHTASKNNGVDFQIIWEADLIVNIEEDGLNKTDTDLEPIIQKNFKTKTGILIASELYLNNTKHD